MVKTEGPWAAEVVPFGSTSTRGPLPHPMESESTSTKAASSIALGPQEWPLKYL